MKKKKIFQLTFSILFSTLLVVSLVYAWTAPTQNPPNGNVEAPINVSDAAQSKLGNFGLGGGAGQSLYWLKNIGGTLYFSSTNPAGDRIVIGQDGNIGIGKSDPQAKLHVNGRIKALDPVDSNDVATKGYVDAQAGSGSIKIVKDSEAGPSSVDCGTGWIIVQCGCSYSNSASDAEAGAVSSYPNGCDWDCYGNSSCSCPSGSVPGPVLFSAIIAECVKE